MSLPTRAPANFGEDVVLGGGQENGVALAPHAVTSPVMASTSPVNK